MMDDPFFQHYWNQSPYLRRREPSVDNLRQQQGKTQTPKVIHIPVFGPEETEAVSKPVAATRIQKVFRGYLVRKCVKKIKGIKKQVDEIDKEVSLKETVELFRRDDKKRLKVNELLMILLFKLDSVRGVDSGVRDCRKGVIKKVIMLQERLDQTETNCETQENWEIVDQANNDECNCESFGQISIEDDYCSAANQFECTEFEPLLVAKQVCAKVEQAEKENLEEEEEEDDSEGKATMDRIVKENERLRRKVMLLCDSNKQQNNLIKTLSKRVDHLEKDFKSEKVKSSRKRRQSLVAQELFF